MSGNSIAALFWGAVWGCVVYTGFSFAHWDVNPGHWSAVARSLAASVLFVGWATVLGVWADMRRP